MILDEKLFEYRIAKENKKYAYDELYNKGFYIRADRDGKADYYIKTKYKEKADRAKKILDKYNLDYTEELYKGNYIIYFNEHVDIPETSYSKTVTETFQLTADGRIENLKVRGHRGTWYEVDKMEVNGKTYYLLESEIWGDEANLLVITEDQSEVYQTFDDIETTLIDLDILKESIKEEKQDIDDKLDVEKEVKEILSSADERHPYMMLDRLKSDCDYFLNYGQGNLKYLWAHNIEDQIALMRGIWNALKEKPEWLTLEDINELEKNMFNFKKELKEDIQDKEYYSSTGTMNKNNSFGPLLVMKTKAASAEEAEKNFEKYLAKKDVGNKKPKAYESKEELEKFLGIRVGEPILIDNVELKEDLEPIVYTNEERAAVGLVSVLNDLIKDEWEAVDKYNSAIVTAQAEGFIEIGNVMFDILNEENTHIGQLQKCMEMLSTTTNKIKEGEQEAEEQLEAEENVENIEPEVTGEEQEEIN